MDDDAIDTSSTAVPASGASQRRWGLFALVAVVCLLIVAGAAALIADYHRAQHRRAEEALSVVAADGASDLADWLERGYADVEIVATQAGIAERYRRWRSGADPEFPRLFGNRIDAERRIRGYELVALIEPDGSVVAASPRAADPSPLAGLAGLVYRALRANTSVFEDHYHGAAGAWTVAWAAPVRQSSETPAIGAMVYVASMERRAGQDLGRQALAYRSAVVSLVREHESGFDRLSSRDAFKATEIAVRSATDAALLEGLAGRSALVSQEVREDGTPVLIAAHRVPKTGWFVTAEADLAEVDAPVWRYGFGVGAAALFLCVALVLGAAFIMRVRAEGAREHRMLLEVQEALAVRERFLASMSHELRTPLQSIIGFTSILLGELAGPLTAEQRHQLGMVDEAAKRLLALIDDVLDLSRIRAGRAEVVVSEFTTGDVERVICGLMHPLIERKAIRCDHTVEDRALTLRTDRDMVERIVLNLVSNAIKFTDEGFVNLDVRADGPEHVVFEVTDSGRGIPPDQIELVMHEFHQVVEPGGVKPVGTGLGLAISRRMAELLGGELGCESQVGVGSRFWLRIPRVHPSA